MSPAYFHYFYFYKLKHNDNLDILLSRGLDLCTDDKVPIRIPLKVGAEPWSGSSDLKTDPYLNIEISYYAISIYHNLKKTSIILQ